MKKGSTHGQVTQGLGLNKKQDMKKPAPKAATGTATKVGKK